MGLGKWGINPRKQLKERADLIVKIARLEKEIVKEQEAAAKKPPRKLDLLTKKEAAARAKTETDEYEKAMTAMHERTARRKELADTLLGGLRSVRSEMLDLALQLGADEFTIRKKMIDDEMDYRKEKANETGESIRALEQVRILKIEALRKEMMDKQEWQPKSLIERYGQQAGATGRSMTFYYRQQLRGRFAETATPQVTAIETTNNILEYIKIATQQTAAVMAKYGLTPRLN